MRSGFLPHRSGAWTRPPIRGAGRRQRKMRPLRVQPIPQGTCRYWLTGRAESWAQRRAKICKENVYLVCSLILFLNGLFPASFLFTSVFSTANS